MTLFAGDNFQISSSIRNHYSERSVHNYLESYDGIFLVLYLSVNQCIINSRACSYLFVIFTWNIVNYRCLIRMIWTSVLNYGVVSQYVINAFPDLGPEGNSHQKEIGFFCDSVVTLCAPEPLTTCPGWSWNLGGYSWF